MGGDPYRTEPLRSCERALDKSRSALLSSGSVEPAPLPGYALLPYVAWSYVPEKVRHVFYAWSLVAAIVVAAYATSLLTGVSFTAIVLAFLPGAFMNVVTGDLPPFAVCALALSALFLARRAFVAAAIAAACSMIEPHVGLASVAALFLFVPQTRRTLLVCGVVALVASFASVGIARNLEYVRDVLPGMSSSELFAADQYSLTRVLVAAGVAHALAIRLGMLAYLIAMSVGIWLGARFAERYCKPEAIVLFPAAAVLFGGAFIHDIQLCIAIPALFVVATTAHRTAVLAWMSLLLVSILLLAQWGPFTWVLRAAPLALCAFVTDRKTLRPLVAATVLSIGIVSLSLLLARAFHGAPTIGARPLPVAALGGDRLASDAWRAWTESQAAQAIPVRSEMALKAPAWLGLLIFFGVAFTLSLRTSTRERADLQEASLAGSP